MYNIILNTSQAIHRVKNNKNNPDDNKSVVNYYLEINSQCNQILALLNNKSESELTETELKIKNIILS